jgi:hypothetical protein
MKQIDEESLEHLMFQCMEIFDIASNWDEPITVHQMKFISVCSNILHRKDEYSFQKRDYIKKKFLSWQNNSNPSMKWITKKYPEHINSKEFSHEDDFSWNGLDKYIESFVMIYVKEIGCDTSQQYLSKNFLKEQKGEL